MPSHRSFTEDLNRNSQLKCKEETCTKNRSRLGGYCQFHSKIAYKFGNALGRPIRKKEYEVERNIVASFLESHLDHPAVKAARLWLDEWLTRSADGDHQQVAWQDLKRLCDGGINSLAILTSAIAVYLYSVRSPQRLPSDARLTYAISRAVLSLAPKLRHTSKTGHVSQVRYKAAASRGVGKRIRENLAALLANVQIGIEAEERAERQYQAALRQPFIVTGLTIPTTETPARLPAAPAGASRGQP